VDEFTRRRRTEHQLHARDAGPERFAPSNWSRWRRRNPCQSDWRRGPLRPWSEQSIGALWFGLGPDFCRAAAPGGWINHTARQQSRVHGRRHSDIAFLKR
jgi:hypothetical protein